MNKKNHKNYLSTLFRNYYDRGSFKPKLIKKQSREIFESKKIDMEEKLISRKKQTLEY